MSGPKVVNIQAVRRQQQRESTATLRELRAILEECLALPEVAFGLRQQGASVLAELERLQAGEQWTQLLARTAAYCQVFRDEADGLRRRAAASRAAELRREQRKRQTGTQLRTELMRLPASAARDEAMRKLAAAQSDEAAWVGAADEVIRWLAESREATMQAKNSERLRELAKVYADPAAGETLPRLLGAVLDPDEKRLERCWTLLAELEVSTGPESTAQWKQQVQTAADAESNQRGLLLDSLVLEISSSIQASRAKKAGVAALQAALSQLEGIHSPEAESWRSRINAAFAQPPTQDMIPLADSVRAWIAQEQRREDALEQREAVLRGLAALGYEVREGMATAWTEQGRIVLRKPNDTQYGVEFSAPTVGTSFQTRVVASGTRVCSQQRDQEVETAWCTEFAQLRILLEAEGFATDLVRAHAPGDIPIKVVGGQEASVDRRSWPQPSQKQYRQPD